MPNSIDVSGMRFGKLSVLKSVYVNNSIRWECKCDCGNTVITYAGLLRAGHCKSCGCLKIESLIKRSKTHGMSNTKIYALWNAMINRCSSNPSNISAKNYFSRGIRVCDRWMKFSNFFEDMKDGFKEGLSIERINVNGNYEKSNCKWIPISEQNLNKRNTIRLEINGQSKLIKEWAAYYGISEDTVRTRLYKGWSAENALRTPPIYEKKFKNRTTE